MFNAFYYIPIKSWFVVQYGTKIYQEYMINSTRCSTQHLLFLEFLYIYNFFENYKVIVLLIFKVVKFIKQISSKYFFNVTSEFKWQIENKYIYNINALWGSFLDIDQNVRCENYRETAFPFYVDTSGW
jgi:hypothetical protein